VGSPRHAPWLGTDWETDASQTREAFPDERFHWLVVDHYGVERRWETTFRGNCENILVIDDLADRNHDCDILLDQNLVADMDKRYAGLVPEDCTKLLGPKYALLQPEYAELRAWAKPRKGPVKRILVYFGGADRENLTGLAVDAIRKMDNGDIITDVVVNPLNPNTENVQELVGRNPKFCLHDNVPSLSCLMINADLCIGGAGTTTWERWCLGLPALVVIMAENQKAIAEETNRQGIVRLIGNAKNVTKEDIKKHIEKIVNTNLANILEPINTFLVDGMGTKRVAEKMRINSLLWK
jgi:UDP-2,4-diacetamido-2,4,6-trideoxy-beta-L-altropyranose hydrolase